MSRLSGSVGRESNGANPKYSRHYFREPHYLVGIDESKSLREKIEDLYGDNHEITDVVSQLDEYFSGRSFGDRPEVQVPEGIKGG